MVLFSSQVNLVFLCLMLLDRPQSALSHRNYSKTQPSRPLSVNGLRQGLSTRNEQQDSSARLHRLSGPGHRPLIQIEDKSSEPLDLDTLGPGAIFANQTYTTYSKLSPPLQAPVNSLMGRRLSGGNATVPGDKNNTENIRNLGVAVMSKPAVRHLRGDNDTIRAMRVRLVQLEAVENINVGLADANTQLHEDVKDLLLLTDSLTKQNVGLEKEKEESLVQLTQMTDRTIALQDLLNAANAKNSQLRKNLVDARIYLKSRSELANRAGDDIEAMRSTLDALMVELKVFLPTLLSFFLSSLALLVSLLLVYIYACI